MMSQDKLTRTIICKTCGVHFEIAKDAEVDFYFYQVKQMGSMKYTTDYNFCSKVCMVKYLKSRKESINSE